MQVDSLPAELSGKPRIDMYIRLYLKSITSKDLLYSAGSTTHCSVTTYMGEEFAKE